MIPLVALGACELAMLIKEGAVSPLDAVDAHIERIREVNPKINAVVSNRFQAAREEAVAAGDAVHRGGGGLGPLHGVPCTIKETFAVRGQPQTAGSVLRKGIVAAEDATVVKRLRSAGAIPLGVTNVPELAMWMESYNNVYGRTRNPFGLDHIPGGSSGGEAAIIGAGGSPFGMGTDIGGSIRMPCFFCGVYGHKPTGGLVPLTGHYPRGHGKVSRYTTAGPITRRATDLMPLLRIVAGPDGKDLAAIDVPLGDPARVRWKGRRVYLLPDLGARFSVGPEHDQRVAAKRAALVLERRGATVEPWRSDLFTHAVLIWSSMVSDSDSPSFGEMLGQGKVPTYRVELLKSIVRRSRFTLPALLLGAGETLLGSAAERFRDMGQALRRELDELLGEDGVLIVPTHSRAAPRHNLPLLRPFDFIYTGIFNVMELPSTAVPMGLGSRKLPVGVQIVGPHGGDHLTIAAAMVLEKANGGWSPPYRSLM